MTAKEYLMQIKNLDERIKNLDDEICSLRERQAALRSPWPDGQPHGTGITDPTGEQAAKFVDELSKLEQESFRLQTELWYKRNEIISMLGRLQTTDHNRLLYLRYVKSAKWEEIAVDMGKTYQWVAGPLHGSALQELENILERLDLR